MRTTAIEGQLGRASIPRAGGCARTGREISDSETMLRIGGHVPSVSVGLSRRRRDLSYSKHTDDNFDSVRKLGRLAALGPLREFPPGCRCRWRTRVSTKAAMRRSCPSREAGSSLSLTSSWGPDSGGTDRLWSASEAVALAPATDVAKAGQARLEAEAAGLGAVERRDNAVMQSHRTALVRLRATRASAARAGLPRSYRHRPAPSGPVRSLAHRRFRPASWTDHCTAAQWPRCDAGDHRAPGLTTGWMLHQPV